MSPVGVPIMQCDRLSIVGRWTRPMTTLWTDSAMTWHLFVLVLSRLSCSLASWRWLSIHYVTMISYWSISTSYQSSKQENWNNSLWLANISSDFQNQVLQTSFCESQYSNSLFIQYFSDNSLWKTTYSQLKPQFSWLTTPVANAITILNNIRLTFSNAQSHSNQIQNNSHFW